MSETDTTGYYNLHARFWIYKFGILIATADELEYAQEAYEENPEQISVWDDEIRDWIM